MKEIARDIQMYEGYIKGNETSIDDHLKMVDNLKVHYTSLLNTAIAYGYEVEDVPLSEEDKKWLNGKDEQDDKD